MLEKIVKIKGSQLSDSWGKVIASSRIRQSITVDFGGGNIGIYPETDISEVKNCQNEMKP